MAGNDRIYCDEFPALGHCRGCGAAVEWSTATCRGCGLDEPAGRGAERTAGRLVAGLFGGLARAGDPLLKLAVAVAIAAVALTLI